MNSRGIAFSAEKIKLMQAMRERGAVEVQTRRVMNPQPVDFDERGPYTQFPVSFGDGGTFMDRKHIRCPYGPVGRILYAKEGYKITLGMGGMNLVTGYYSADGAAFQKLLTDAEAKRFWKRKYPHRASPGRFMYKSLARHWFEVMEIRAQQIQDMVGNEFLAEGAPERLGSMDWFIGLWNRINAGRGFPWESNPWAWALTLRWRMEASDGT